MSDTNWEGWYQQVLAAVALLAASACDQVAWLEKHDAPVDEIALNFDDSAVMAPQLADAGWLTPEALSELAHMDDLLNRLTADEGSTHWTAEGLRTDALWAQIRQEADRFLRAQGATDQALPLAEALP
ncbi:hypothetical protein LG634_08795 [Streptomyces bambusae]|uniref:hypothetical protein n=1 Tax=Streptomyces bambusae TaxID=1550616 RepID=UPI001CFE3ECE|nr:hypothetical protein [Streptomyces bambusae]MCB5164925.1 hypothetical protein [Streptomyces bambusae]